MNDEWDIPDDISSDAVYASDSGIKVIGDGVAIDEYLKAGKNGVDIPNEVYHRLPGISGSNLSLLAESNKHLDHKELFSLGETDALIFGTLVHALVLEPHTVENDYAVMPIYTAENKTESTIAKSKQVFKESNEGKIIIQKDDFEKAELMTRNVLAIYGDEISNGIKERSLFSDIDGLILKCRLDIELPNGDDIDLKTITTGTKGFSDFTLESHIKKLNYHRSAAFRNIVRRSLGIKTGASYLLFVDSSIGNMVRLIQIHPDWVSDAEFYVTELLENRRFYLESGVDNRPFVIDDRYRDNY